MFKHLKKVFLFSILLLGLIVVLAGCGGQSEKGANADKAETIKLNLAHFWPATHEMETKIIKGYIEEIDKATNGRVKITSFPAGTLVPAAETYDGVVKGVVDMGLSVYAYNRGRFPVVETFLLPGIEWNNSEAATEALMEGIEKFDPEELKDTHQMFSFAAGPGDLFTKKAIRTLADIKGLQLGATAGLRADAVGLLGASPVVQPMPEWYESLSKGIMQGGVAPLETFKGFRLGEVTGDYITLTPFLYNQAFFLTMNNEKWNSLPADVQQAITEVNEKYVKEVMAPWFNSIDKGGLDDAKAKKKVEVITLSDAEKANWLAKLKPLEDQYIKTLNEKGLNGADIVKGVKELAEKYNAQYPEKAPYTK